MRYVVLLISLVTFRASEASETILEDFYSSHGSALQLDKTQQESGGAQQRELVYLLGLHYYHQARSQDTLAETCEFELHQRLDKAAMYLRHAAQLGHPGAKYVMGYLHLVGFASFEENPRAALGWLEDAIKHGSEEAMLTLGTILINGYKFQKDIYLGLDLLNIVLAKGNPAAGVYLDWAESYLHHERRKQLAWIQRQRPANFTIEYSVTLNEQSVRKFLISNPGIEVSAMYRTKNNTWKLVFGSFSTRYLAQEKLKERFGDLLVNQFIIRRMASVQEEVLPVNPTRKLDWIRTQKPGSHTLLLGTFAREADAQDFIVFTGLQNAALVKIRPLAYWVLAGEFDSAISAQKAIPSLPDNLQTYSPSPIAFSDVADSLTETTIETSSPYAHISIIDQAWVREQAIKTVFTENKVKKKVWLDIESQLLNAIQSQNLPLVDGSVNAIQWLDELDTGLYTVGLFRADSRHQALDMASFIGLDGAHVVQDRKGIWHLLTGIFANRESAIQAIMQLPEAVSVLQPTAVAVSDMKQSLNEPQLGLAQIASTEPDLQLHCVENQLPNQPQYLENNESVTVLSRVVGWSQIQDKSGLIGWVQSKFLTRAAP